MTRPLLILLTAVASSLALGAAGARPARAAAPNVCSLPDVVRTEGPPCPRAPAPAQRETSDLLGPVGTVIGKITGTGVTLALGALVAVVVRDAAAALRFTESLIGTSTRPNLSSTWFSASYWRVAAVSALLTLPFLFAAAIHALVRSDLGLLGRAAFGYLPLGLIGVGLAAPVTTLVLSATDEMSSFVASASGNADSTFLGHASLMVATASAVNTDPFIAFFVGSVTVAATMALWAELLVRDAAVYVIVLMLPLFFAAMVWPARRVWAIRAIETLFALILSKFAIVSVLSLGGAAMSHTLASGPASLLVGVTLVSLATLSPWALLRLLPIHEVAAAAAAGLSAAPRAVFGATTEVAVDSVTGAVARLAGALAPGGEDEAVLQRMTGEGAGDLGDRRPAAAADVGNSAPGADEEADPGLAAVSAAGLQPAPVSSEGAGEAGADDGSAAPPASGEVERPRERIPGAEAMYQAANGAWPVVVLGEGVEVPAPLMGPAEAEAAAPLPRASEDPPPPDATAPPPPDVTPPPAPGSEDERP